MKFTFSQGLTLVLIIICLIILAGTGCSEPELSSDPDWKWAEASLVLSNIRGHKIEGYPHIISNLYSEDRIHARTFRIWMDAIESVEVTTNTTVIIKLGDGKP